MEKFKLDQKEVVLVIVDMQERLMQVMPDKEQVYKNTNILLAAARQMGIPVIITEQYPQGLGNTVAEIKDNLAEYDPVEKMRFSAYSDIQQQLAGMNRKTILLTGSETHVCVYQTTRDLIASGYNVHLLKDAVCSRFKENYKNGLELMREVGAVLTNTETVVFDLLQVAGSPDFKVISKLIK